MIIEYVMKAVIGSNLKVSAVNSVSSYPGDNYCKGVHDEHHYRAHEGHHTVCEKLCLLQFQICLIKPGFLHIFPAESSYYLKSGKDFP